MPMPMPMPAISESLAPQDGNLTIIKNAICTNKFEWPREWCRVFCQRQRRPLRSRAERSIWLLNLTIRIYQWASISRRRSLRFNCVSLPREVIFFPLRPTHHLKVHHCGPRNRRQIGHYYKIQTCIRKPLRTWQFQKLHRDLKLRIAKVQQSSEQFCSAANRQQNGNKRPFGRTWTPAASTAATATATSNSNSSSSNSNKPAETRRNSLGDLGEFKLLRVQEN